MAKLIPQLIPLGEGPGIPLIKPIVLIGRHQECDYQVPSRKISRRHCCIAQVSTYLVVRDLGSTNGIRINGVRVQEGQLHPGDELTLGDLRYQARWVEQADPLPRRAAAPLRPGDSGEEPIALPEQLDSPPVPRGRPLHPGPGLHAADGIQERPRFLPGPLLPPPLDSPSAEHPSV